MKPRLFALGMLVLVTHACTTAPPNPATPPAASARRGFDQITYQRRAAARLEDVCDLARCVPLETSDQALIGHIDKVETVSAGGDLLIGDYDGARAVLQYTADGRFIRKIGKTGEGPGEYPALNDFTVNQAGQLFLLGGHKLMRFSRTGALEKEVILTDYVFEIHAAHNQLYLRTRRRGGGQAAPDITVYNEDLQPVGGIGTQDPHLQTYLYTPGSSMASSGNRLFFTGIYDASLTMVSGETTATARFARPSEAMIEAWRTQPFTEAQRRIIKAQVHRFSMIHALDQTLVLLESQRDRKLLQMRLIDLASNSGVTFGAGVFSDADADTNPSDWLRIAYIAGSAGDELIGIVDQAETFATYKHRHPQLAQVSFSDADNPLLVFLKIRADVWQAQPTTPAGGGDAVP